MLRDTVRSFAVPDILSELQIDRNLSNLAPDSVLDQHMLPNRDPRYRGIDRLFQGFASLSITRDNGIPSTWVRRDGDLLAKLEQQPYQVDLDGIKLTIDKSVFPPDFGASSCYIAKSLRRLVKEIPPRRALDMGCGSGFLAITLAQAGVREVWATDAHAPAVACTKKNILQNSSSHEVRVTQGDLFGGIPRETSFDLMVFNQPYYPTQTEPFGPAKDGGQEIIRRFLNQAGSYLSPGGVMVMPYSLTLVGAEHNPARICREEGFYAQVLSFVEDFNGKHFVFAIRRASRNNRLAPP